MGNSVSVNIKILRRRFKGKRIRRGRLGIGGGGILLVEMAGILVIMALELGPDRLIRVLWTILVLIPLLEGEEREEEKGRREIKAIVKAKKRVA